MIKLLPKKIIAALIVVFAYTKIFLKKYGIILFFILLSVFLAYKCYYYKQLAAEFEREMRDIDNYAVELEEKLESEENIKPTPAGIDIEALKKKHKVSAKDLYIPDIPEAHRTHREYYYPTQPTYTPPPQTENYYKKSQEDYLQQQNKEIEERRIMQLESKVNNLELERDMRLLNY